MQTVIDHNKNNPKGKEMWKQINQVISGKDRCSKTTTITTIKNDQGNFIQDDKLIIDQFNILLKLAQNYQIKLFMLVRIF